MSWLPDLVNPFRARARSGRVVRQRQRERGMRAPFELLESRLALAKVAPSNFPVELSLVGTELFVLYSQPNTDGFVQTSDQHVVIDIDEFFPAIGVVQQRVNVYASSNPAANFGAVGGINKTFLGVTAIHVTVPNYDDPGVNNNSLTIKGINGPTDRIIVSGSGRTAAGRWSDEAAPQLQVVFDIAGIDDLTVTAGGIINVSGAFTNDTGDASIHAVGEIAERQADQMTGTIIVGETTPSPGALPQARLISDFIEIIGAEIDIYSDIQATGHVILRQPATTPQTARANLILPYDITVTDPDGVLELHSTKNIVQLQSSTLIANKAVAVSNVGDINVVDGEDSEGPWLIDLGSVNNDFNTISLGMVSNAIDTPDKVRGIDARGRIGVRDIDDLTVADFGVLATTGIVTLRSVGPLTIDAAIQASGLTLQSDTRVVSTPRAIMSINSPTPGLPDELAEPVVFTDLGVTIDVSTAAAPDVTGDVVLDGRIVMDLNNVRELTGEDDINKTGYGGVTIHAAGVTTLNSQILTLGDIRVHSRRGINVAGQLQAGGTFLSKNGSVVELVAADLSLTTATGDITVTAPTANLPLPTTLSATNLLAMDAGGDITLAGSLFAGSLFNDTADLPEDNATLPSITIRALGDVVMTETSVLKTRAYGTNFNASPNPQIGLITVSDANSVTSAATIDADGAYTISTRGDITLSGAATSREAISLRTQSGDIDVQGGLTTRGAAYTVDPGATPPFVVPASWTPNIVMLAPNGAVMTSDTGDLTAGRSTIDGQSADGRVRIVAQQNITIGADIAAPGGLAASSRLGQFTIVDSTLSMAAVDPLAEDQVATIRAGSGISQDETSRIRGGLDLSVTDGDIVLESLANDISSLRAFSSGVGGQISVKSRQAMSTTGVEADGEITLRGAGNLTMTAATVARSGDVLIEAGGTLTFNGVLQSVKGKVDIDVQQSLRDASGGITQITLVSGGGGYDARASVGIAPPSGGGVAATARPIVVGGVITQIVLVTPGSGYALGEQPAVTIFPNQPGPFIPGTGAQAVALAGAPIQRLVANSDLTVKVGQDVSLLNFISSEEGMVRVTSKSGDLLFDVSGTTIRADKAGVILTAEGGSIDIPTVDAFDELTIDAAEDVTASSTIILRDSGKLSVTSRFRNIDFSNSSTAVSAKFGDVSFSAPSGSLISPPALHVGGDISVATLSEITLGRQVVADSGDIKIESTSGSITIASNLNAITGDVSLSAQGNVSQVGSTGITRIVVVRGGAGYSSGANVTIAGPSGGGVAATAIAVIGVVAGVPGVIVDIQITNPGQGYAVGENPVVTIAPVFAGVGSGAVASAVGPTGLQNLSANGDITIVGQSGVRLSSTVSSLTGDIAVSAARGDVQFESTAKVHVPNGSLTLRSTLGTVGSPPVTNAGGTVTIESHRALQITNSLTSQSGDILLTSDVAGIALSGNVASRAGVTRIKAGGEIRQLTSSGISSITLLSGGGGYTSGATVTIAPPAAGGTPATATAVIGIVGGVPGVITAITVTNPGSGYAINESPTVTITAVPPGVVTAPAVASAVGPTGFQDILGFEGVIIEAGQQVALANTIRSDSGDVSVLAFAGDLVFASGSQIIASAGSVTLTSVTGAVTAPTKLQASEDIAIIGKATLTASSPITSTAGDVTLTSTNSDLVISADVRARDRISLNARTGMTQPAGSLRAAELVVNNSSNAAVQLVNAANNVDQFAGKTLGQLTYVDADDFETGVERTTIGVEVSADVLNLSSAGIRSTLRVVSGLSYRTLSLAAGAAGTNVGVVEFVTTSEGDNLPAGSGFAGTLRDMIRYANDNTAVYQSGGAARPQPQAMVFDEDGYDVETITVGAAALPGFRRPVRFEGGRLTADVLVTDPSARLGIAASPGTTATSGLRFDLGSSGSSVSRLAVGGFTRGSGIHLASGGSTVTDVWAGLAADGSPRSNWAGIDVSGTGANGNLIGSVVVDPETRNRFSNNGVGVLIRNGASGTLVFGNLISANGTPTTQGDGIRINGATNTSVGTPDAVQPDLVSTSSNEITDNAGSGIRIVTTNAGTLGTANRIRNNFISGNRGTAGIAVNGSQFAVIGGLGRGANTIVNQIAAGIDITDSGTVRVLGNDIGLDDSQGNAIPSGNGGNGITVSGSRQVGITAGNRIVANALNGILIENASTGVNVASNTIGQPQAGNARNGIAIMSSIGNVVGAGNVISSNAVHGVSIENARAANLTAGNRVFGSLVTANGESGINISGGSFSWIGGTKVGEANLIQSNTGSGITLQWNAVAGSPTGVTIQGNRIGTNADRDVTSLGNGGTGIRLIGATNAVVAGDNAIMNNSQDGVSVEGGSGNVIGGSVAGTGNEISANAGHGVVVRAATLAGLPTTLQASRTVRVMGNTITGNAGNGVQVNGAVGAPSVVGATIGQTASATGTVGRGNTITGNGGFGIEVAAGAQQVGFQGNSIAENSLGGVQVAAGANRSTAQSIALRSAVLRGTGASQSVTIAGTLSNPTGRQQQYMIDFFASSPGDGDYSTMAGYQARRFIGRATVVADASGRATFSLRITAPLEVGDVITAMATSLRFEAGSTSILSNAVTADLPGIPTPRF